MNIPKSQPDKVLRRVDHCLYCDSESELTDEHIVPLSFGGRYILEAASCPVCRDITSALEGKCCSTMFRALRVHHQTRTRRPKSRPTTLAVLDSEDPTKAQPTVLNVPTDKAPGIAVFPLFGAPGLMVGGAGSPNAPLIGISHHRTTDDLDERVSRLRDEGISNPLVFAEYMPHEFARTLAKIAHGFAVAAVGLGGFGPLLRPVIRGEVGDVGQFVGGGIDPPPSHRTPSGTGLHRASPVTMKLDGTIYLAYFIQLFCYLDPVPPSYIVITGKYLGPEDGQTPMFVR